MTLDIARDIEDFVRDIGRVTDDDEQFTRSADLFDNGYIDSLGVVALTSYVEERYGVMLAEEDLFDSRLTTIAGLVDLIASKRDPEPQSSRAKGTP